MEEQDKITFAQGVDELQRLLARLEQQIAERTKKFDELLKTVEQQLDEVEQEEAERPQTFEEFEQHEDRAEIACERCATWPCVCGEPEFETQVSQDLDGAAEVD